MLKYQFLLQAQNEPQGKNLGELLLNEAFSNYVVFILGILFGVIGWGIVTYISRTKPQIIEVVKKEQVSLLKIDSQVERDIKLEYKGQQIASLHRTSFHLFNRGEEKVEDITLTIHTDTPDLQTNVFDSLIVDSSEIAITDATVAIVGKGIEVKIKFLNPFKGYRDQLTLHIFSSNPLKAKDAKGRGSGWGVTYFDRIKYEQDIDKSISKAVSGGWFSLLEGLAGLLVVWARAFLR